MALIINIIICPCILLIIITCIPYPIADAISVVNHQQFFDSSKDWTVIESPTGSYAFFNRSVPTANINSNCSVANPIDIKGVSFSSNGDIHQSTIWVPLISINNDINKGNASKMAPYTWINGGYQMAIDIISSYDNGVNYINKLKWDMTNQTWIQTLEEISMDRESEKENKIIDSKVREFKNQTKFVDLPLDLKKINSPDRYKIIYSAWGAFLNDMGQYCLLMDSTGFTDIPPPEIEILIPELPHSIRKGESINIPIELKSSSGQNTLAKMNVTYGNISNKSALHFNIVPNEVSISPYGVGYAILEIRASNVDYPAYINVASNISFNTSPVLQTGKVIDSVAPITFTLQEKYPFTLIILPELTFLDFVNNFLSTWGIAFSQILALIVTIGGAIAAIMGIKKHVDKQKNYDLEKDDSK
jgi:hypothetical protein